MTACLRTGSGFAGRPRRPLPAFSPLGTARAGAAAAALLCCLAAGCGYSVGYDLPDASGSSKIGLAVVGNSTLRQRFELPLTQALQEQLPIHTGLRPVAPGRAADLLEVDIADVRNRSMAGPGLPPLQTGVPVREGALEFAVTVRLVDAIDGSVRREWQIYDRAELRIAVGETEESALQEATFDLARKITLALEDASTGPATVSGRDPRPEDRLPAPSASGDN